MTNPALSIPLQLGQFSRGWQASRTDFQVVAHQTVGITTCGDMAQTNEMTQFMKHDGQ